jgi:ParB family transcriptional regulator, chromosome partitioning protein
LILVSVSHRNRGLLKYHLGCFRRGFLLLGAIARVKDEEERKELIEVAIAENLSLSQISDRIKATKELTTTENSLKERYKQTLRRLQKSKVWDNPKKQKALEKLLTQIESLIEE